MDSRKILGGVLSALLAAPAAQAQHVIDRTALDRAVQNRIAREKADRETLLSLLARQEVRELADRAGLSLVGAETAVRTLGPDDLRQMAHEARRNRRGPGRRIARKDRPDRSDYCGRNAPSPIGRTYVGII